MPVLPNYRDAVIEEDKFVNYALSPHSERGQHKARVFEQVLGFNLSNWTFLKRAILSALPDQQATFSTETVFGRKYEVVVPVTGPNGRTANVTTIWQYDRLDDETGYSDSPRLVTLYIKEASYDETEGI